jgi:hypothetical protein
MVAVSSDQGIILIPIAGGPPRPVPGLPAHWQVVGWVQGGLLVSEDPLAGGTIYRVEPTTGRRETWTSIEPEDPAGIMNLDLSTLAVTPDGRGYAYTWHRATSDLYLAEGWV